MKGLWRGMGWALAATLLVLLGVLAWWRFGTGSSAAVAEVDVLRGPEPSRRRVPIPRPPRPPPPDRNPSDPPPPSVDSPPSPDSPPRVGVVPPQTPQPATEVPEVQGAPADLATTLKAEIGAVTPQLLACLDGWHAAQPEVFVGKVTFSFHLDGGGVAEMEVLDVVTVPEATLGCLGDVLWEDVAWPQVAEPLEVTWPVQVSVEPEP